MAAVIKAGKSRRLVENLESSMPHEDLLTAIGLT
jgi:hypothetical protein